MKHLSVIPLLPTLLRSKLAFLLVFALLACDSKEESITKDNTAQLQITVENVANGQPLVLGTGRYLNANGDTFLVNNLQYYISNIRFRNRATGAFYYVRDSYHLIRASGQSNKQVINIGQAKAGDYTEVEFSLGVDNVANASMDIIGDLNQTNGMYWSWLGGYKFLLLEGGYSTSTGQKGGLVFHVGDNANFRTMRFTLKDLGLPNIALRDGGTTQINITTELDQLFRQPHIIRFAEVNNVEFDPIITAQLADNYANGMFRITNIGNPQ